MCGSRNREEKRKGGGEDGTLPSNNDWALWMSGGEAQGCCFFCFVFTGYGLLPARCCRQTDRQEETVWVRLSKERRMPPNYDSAVRKVSVPKKSHSKQQQSLEVF